MNSTRIYYRNANNRNGLSMIEVLFVATLSSILLIMTVSWIHKVMTFSTSTKLKQRHHMTLTRFSNDLRQDVRSSVSAQLSGENTLQLTRRDGSKVNYEIVPKEQMILKTVKFLSTDGSNQEAFERYHLNKKTTTFWDASELPDWISLVVARRQFAFLPSPSDPSIDLNEGLQSVPDEEMPIDLHIRVKINRLDIGAG